MNRDAADKTSISRAPTRFWSAWQAMPRAQRVSIAAFLVWTALLTLAYVQPLTRLIRYARDSELLSYIPLVPFVAAYLLYLQRKDLPRAYRRSTSATVALCVVGLAALVASVQFGGTLSLNDGLAVIAFSYVCLAAAGGFLFFGTQWMVTAAFPVAFLLFIVPLPDSVVFALETASVLASADVSAALFRMTGTPLLREGNVFVIPGIVLEVAKECSGIHSSWVLFITSLVASHLFLKTTWRRAVLVAFVIPLAIVRNSVRILVIGLLCVHIGPHMIDSVIHHRGGPIFFALSLIPLFLLLAWLRRQER